MRGLDLRVASVIIVNTTRKFDREYDYVIPEDIASTVKTGQRVIVPFGRANRYEEAFVLEVNEKSSFRGGLKEIKSLVDGGERPFFSEAAIPLIKWMKDRYICTYGDAVRCLIPPGTGINVQKIAKLVEAGVTKSKNEKALLDVLLKDSECELQELLKKAGLKNGARTVKSLEKKGYIKIEEDYSIKVKDKILKAVFLTRTREEVIEEVNSLRIGRINQIKVLELLVENGLIPVAEILRVSGVTKGTLETLKKNGFIDFKDMEVTRDPFKGRNIERTLPMRPTPGQSRVLAAVKELMDRECYNEVLLRGVTGSGKTEVYLQLIEHCFNKGKTAIMLVPEISLTPQMVERFKGRFGEEVAVIHSGLSLGERYDQWKLIIEARVKVVVGARSAVFSPLKNLGLIIVDEEQEGSYKSELTPKYHAVEIARKRCTDEKAVMILGSATPSVENYYNAVSGKTVLLEMLERANSLPLPRVRLVDMRKELEEGNRSIFSRSLTEQLSLNAGKKEQSILFLNKRGYASFVLCRSCGRSMKCPHCSITLTYHSKDARLICHYCGYTAKTPEACPKCSSSYLRPFGSGTQKVEEEIAKNLSGVTVIRMDMDSTTYKNSHEDILRRFREDGIDIMVGTQMVAKGHDFPNVTLVGVLAADSLLNVGDYRASERTFQLLTQVAGRAGRGNIPGRVVIQSYNTEDYSILASCRQDYERFYRQEIQVRKSLGYPPFTNIAVIILSGFFDRTVFSRAKDLANTARNRYEAGTDTEVIGPGRPPMSKIRNKYRWRIIIKCSGLDRLTGLLTELSDEYNSMKSSKTVELSMDINPVNML